MNMKKQYVYPLTTAVEAVVSTPILSGSPEPGKIQVDPEQQNNIGGAVPIRMNPVRITVLR